MKFLEPMIVAFSMYSKIPMPRIEWNKENMKYMMCFFPLIGVVTGVLIYLAGMFLDGNIFPKVNSGRLMFAAVMTLIPVFVSGGIHLDGFMDVTDAVGSCRDLAKRREILKDSHVGSFAVIGVVLLILCQFAFCVSFNQKTDIRVLIVIPVVSRCRSALAVALLPKMSTSQYVRKQAKAADIWIPCAFLAGAIAFAFLLRFRCGLVLLVQAAGYGLALRKAYRSLEGMNGDISGYALTLSELSALGALAIL